MIPIHVRFALVALMLSLGCGYENAVPFPHDSSVEAAVLTPDAAAPEAAADGPAPADAPVAEAAATPADTAPADLGEGADVEGDDGPTTCAGCYTRALAEMTGACKVARPNGCDDIPADGVGVGMGPGDRALCQALDDCMKTTGCWATADGPSNCFCGTATNLTCTTGAANGPCKAQIMAATKATIELLAGTLLFSPNLPSGFAAQKYACYKASCLALCK